MILDSKIPGGPIAEKWTRHKFELKLVNPTNKRKFTVIVDGSGQCAPKEGFVGISKQWVDHEAEAGILHKMNDFDIVDKQQVKRYNHHRNGCRQGNQYPCPLRTVL